MNMGTIHSYLVVMLGGALGSGARLWLSTVFAARYGEAFPLGTIAVNVLGCFIIGLYAGLTGPGGPFPVSPLARQFVTIGILGGFTTFSSFSLQTYLLVSTGDWFRGMLNVILSLGFCLLAVWCGAFIAGAIAAK